MTNYTTIDVEDFTKRKVNENEIESISIVNKWKMKVDEIYIENKTINLELKYVHTSRLYLHEGIKRLKLNYSIIDTPYKIPRGVEELNINKTSIRFHDTYNINKMELTGCVLKFTELPNCQTLVLGMFGMFDGLEMGKIPECRDLVIKNSYIEDDGIDKFIEKGYKYASITVDTCNISEESLNALRNATNFFKHKDFYEEMKKSPIYT
jgi:hypothetical protein